MEIDHGKISASQVYCIAGLPIRGQSDIKRKIYRERKPTERSMRSVFTSWFEERSMTETTGNTVVSNNKAGLIVFERI